VTQQRKPGGIGDDCRAWLYARAVACRGRLSCVYCDAWLTRVSLATRLDPQHVATLDHVVALARGGTNGPDNLVVCCCSCNAAKRDRPLAERAAVRAELRALPSAQALAAWRRKILLGGLERSQRRSGEPAARWGRMLASKAWATPDAPGLHASRVQCQGGAHRWPVVGQAESGRGDAAGQRFTAPRALGVNASGASAR